MNLQGQQMCLCPSVTPSLTPSFLPQTCVNSEHPLCTWPFPGSWGHRGEEAAGWVLFPCTQGDKGLARQKEQHVGGLQGHRKLSLRKEGAMGRDEGSALYPHGSSPLTAHPRSGCKRGSEQNCAQCSPGSVVAQLGMSTTGGSVAVWGTKAGLRPARSCPFGQM